MKTIILLFLSLFVSKSCQNKKEATTTEPKTEMAQNNPVQESKIATQEATLVQYEATTRGSFLKITYQNAKLWISKDRNLEGNGLEISLSKEQVSEIEKVLKLVNKEGLSGLKAPTEKRFYDGAAHANLKITTSGTEYQTEGFDAGFPPKEIEKIVLLLGQLAEKTK